MSGDYKKIKENVYTARDNFVAEVDEIYVAVALMDGQEGILSRVDFSIFPPIEKPMMGATITDKDAILKCAELASKEAGIKINVIKLSKREVIKTFYPEGSH